MVPRIWEQIDSPWLPALCHFTFKLLEVFISLCPRTSCTRAGMICFNCIERLHSIYVTYMAVCDEVIKMAKDSAKLPREIYPAAVVA